MQNVIFSTSVRLFNCLSGSGFKQEGGTREGGNEIGCCSGIWEGLV